MNPNMKKWLDNNAPGYEVQKSTAGGSIAFVPSPFADKTMIYIKRFHPHMHVEWRGNYTWLAIFVG